MVTVIVIDVDIGIIAPTDTDITTAVYTVRVVAIIAPVSHTATVAVPHS